MTTTTDKMQKYLDTALNDLRILSGDAIGPPDATWQDVAGTAVVNLRLLADHIERLRTNMADHPASCEPFPVFPEVRLAGSSGRN